MGAADRGHKVENDALERPVPAELGLELAKDSAAGFDAIDVCQTPLKGGRHRKEDNADLVFQHCSHNLA